MAVLEGGTSDDAAGYGAKDSHADRTGARDGAVGPGVCHAALIWTETKSTG